MTRPDGTVVAFGGNTGCTASPADPTAIYTPSSNSWATGPNVPAICGTGGTTSCDLADAPAALLPNGNILFAASAGYGTSPTHFFEFTTANVINQVADTVFFASSSGAYYYNFLVLPNGQILATDFSGYVEIYTPTGSPNAAWAPTITSVASCVIPGNSYLVSGTQLNGLSQGAAYGDDVQGATNYPLVQDQEQQHRARVLCTHLRSQHHVDRSEPGRVDELQGGGGHRTRRQHALRDRQRHCLYRGKAVTVGSTCAPSATATHDFNGDGKSDIAWRDTSGNAAVWLMNGATAVAVRRSRLGATAWSVVGQRDFDGDGKSDWLWHDTSGNVAIWFMNGTAVSSRPVSEMFPLPGRSSERGTSTATARATFCGATPAATWRSG